MQTPPYQNDIAQRMTHSTDNTITTDAAFYQTTNGYWIA